MLDNLVDQVWGAERPARPANPIIVHPVKLAGQRVDEKIAAVRKVIAEKEAAALFVSALDDVAWLLNIRGTDIDCASELALCSLTMQTTRRRSPSCW